MIKYLGKCDKGSKPNWRNNKTLLKQDKKYLVKIAE